MERESISVVSTSSRSATVSDIVLRETPQVRLVFRPEIVENSQDPTAALRGTFLYRKKGKHDTWTDIEVSSLARLKKGEGYKLELHAGELLRFLREAGLLYRLARSEGVPVGSAKYVKMEQHLARFLELSEEDLNSFLTAHPHDAVLTLKKVLTWFSNSAALAELVANDIGQLSLINAALGVSMLRSMRNTWEQNSTNASEEFWQGMLAKHSFVLSQAFAYPVVVIRGKAYVGGKRLDNQHGNVADFLGQVESSGNALIIEIKTPTTALLGAEYRDEVFPLSGELVGAIGQVLKYRDSFSAEARSIAQDSTPPILQTDPRCLVIAGTNAALKKSVQKQSFERFRERLTGVTLITFDELFGRIRQLEQLFEVA